jgi:hypothetical protein
MVLKTVHLLAKSNFHFSFPGGEQATLPEDDVPTTGGGLLAGLRGKLKHAVQTTIREPGFTATDPNDPTKTIPVETDGDWLQVMGDFKKNKPLRQKAKRATQVEFSAGKLLSQRGDAEALYLAVHGLWEMAVLKENHDLFNVKNLSALGELMKTPRSMVDVLAAGLSAIWCLASSGEVVCQRLSESQVFSAVFHALSPESDPKVLNTAAGVLAAMLEGGRRSRDLLRTPRGLRALLLVTGVESRFGIGTLCTVLQQGNVHVGVLAQLGAAEALVPKLASASLQVRAAARAPPPGQRPACR